jgi:hypothetical protein
MASALRTIKSGTSLDSLPSMLLSTKFLSLITTLFFSLSLLLSLSLFLFCFCLHVILTHMLNFSNNFHFAVEKLMQNKFFSKKKIFVFMY